MAGDVEIVRQLALAPDGAVSDVEINGRHLSFIASRLTYRGEEVILATFSDISDHKRVQAALAGQARRRRCQRGQDGVPGHHEP